MKKLRVRKKIRLSGYNYSLSGVYFVTFCTRNKWKILGNVVGAGFHARPLNQMPCVCPPHKPPRQCYALPPLRRGE